MPTPSPIIGVDFVSIPTQDFDRSIAFYGETLGLTRVAFDRERFYAEFQAGNLTINIHDPVAMKIGEFSPNRNALALQVADTAAARTQLEAAGVTFAGDVFDTSVCHMAFFADPDGNALMLHHRYAPRTPQPD